MGEFGRGAKATAAQRAEVERLAAGGLSVRRVAAEVFGDARFRGRVERILRPPAAAGPLALLSAAVPLLEGVDVAALGTTASIRLLLERRLAYWLASGAAPSVGELRNLLEVQRRLEAAESVERTRRRHQDRAGPE